MLRFQGTDIYLATPVTGNLDRNVGGRAKSIKTEPLTGLHPAEPQGSVTDDASTEERRRFLIGKRGGNRIGKGCGHHGVFGIAAIDLIAGEARCQAQVLSAAPAILTVAA